MFTPLQSIDDLTTWVHRLVLVELKGLSLDTQKQLPKTRILPHEMHNTLSVAFIDCINGAYYLNFLVAHHEKQLALFQIDENHVKQLQFASLSEEEQTSYLSLIEPKGLYSTVIWKFQQVSNALSQLIHQPSSVATQSIRENRPF